MGETREKRKTVEGHLNWVHNFISKRKQNNKTKTKEEATKSELVLFSAVEEKNILTISPYLAENKLLI